MSTLRFPFELEDPAGNPLAPDSLVLRDSGGAFGIRRVDTLAIVVAAQLAAPGLGAGIVQDAVGSYHYDLLAAVDGIEYEIEWRCDPPGASGAFFYNQILTAGAAAGPPASGYYTNQQSILDLIGQDNLQVISDPENDQTTIDTAALGRSIADADTDINRRVREWGIFKAPITIGGVAITGLDHDTTRVFDQAARRFATWHLNQKRALAASGDMEQKTQLGMEKAIDRICEAHLKEAERILCDIRFHPGSIVADRLLDHQPSKVGIFPTRPARSNWIPAGPIVLPP